MPIINNLENNILMEICLVNNSELDVQLSRSDWENWIPFTFLLEVPNERYFYDDKNGATFNLFETKRLIGEVRKLIHLRKHNQAFEKTFEDFKFFNIEAQLGIVIYDPLEENELGIIVWIKMGAHSNGQIVGFDTGYDFVASLSCVEKFVNELDQQLIGLLGKLEY